MREPSKVGPLGAAWRVADAPSGSLDVCGYWIKAHVAGVGPRWHLITVRRLRPEERWYGAAAHGLFVASAVDGTTDDDVFVGAVVEVEPPPLAAEQTHGLTDAAAASMAGAAAYQVLEGLLPLRPSSTWRKFVQHYAGCARDMIASGDAADFDRLAAAE